jgi:phospholipase C
VLLDDSENNAYDPNHSQGCELGEINGGRMNHFVQGTDCSDRRNFAYAQRSTAGIYWDLADHYALADHYFQSIAGASSSNDMYFARAQYVFTDNSLIPASAGSVCGGEPSPARRIFEDKTIGSLLEEHGTPWAFYAEGYEATLQALKHSGSCMAPHPSCPSGVQDYPCTYDPRDNPFQYYRSSLDTPATERDYSRFTADLQAGTLPSVSWIKGLGFRTEHPGSNIRDGMEFVDGVIKAVLSSAYARDTLVLVTYDESGGFFDHRGGPVPW